MDALKTYSQFAHDALNAASGDYFAALQYVFDKAHKSPRGSRFWADVILDLNELCDVGKD